MTTPAQFIKHEVENSDDWSEWVDQDAESYLIKCCDCGLVHEMQFRVAVFANNESDEHTVLTDQNTKAQFRARQHSAKRLPMTMAELKQCSQNMRDACDPDFVPPEVHIGNAPQQLNLNDKAFWLIGWNECRAALLKERKSK